MSVNAISIGVSNPTPATGYPSPIDRQEILQQILAQAIKLAGDPNIDPNMKTAIQATLSSLNTDSTLTDMMQVNVQLEALGAQAKLRYETGQALKNPNLSPEVKAKIENVLSSLSLNSSFIDVKKAEAEIAELLGNKELAEVIKMEIAVLQEIEYTVGSLTGNSTTQEQLEVSVRVQQLQSMLQVLAHGKQLLNQPSLSPAQKMQVLAILSNLNANSSLTELLAAAAKLTSIMIDGTPPTTSNDTASVTNIFKKTTTN